MFVVFVCVKKMAKHFMCADTDEVSFIFYSKICFCREGYLATEMSACVRACARARVLMRQSNLVLP